MELVHAKILGPHMPNPVYCTSASVSISQHPAAGPGPSSCRQPWPLSQHPSPAAPAPAATPGNMHPPKPASRVFPSPLPDSPSPIHCFWVLCKASQMQPPATQGGSVPELSRAAHSCPRQPETQLSPAPEQRFLRARDSPLPAAHLNAAWWDRAQKLPAGEPTLSDSSAPAGHQHGHSSQRQSQTQTHQSFLGISEAEQQTWPFSGRPGMLGPLQRLPCLSAAPVPPHAARHQRGPAEPLTTMPGLPIHRLSSDTPTLQCLLILSGFESLRHIHGYHRN